MTDQELLARALEFDAGRIEGSDDRSPLTVTRAGSKWRVLWAGYALSSGNRWVPKRGRHGQFRGKLHATPKAAFAAIERYRQHLLRQIEVDPKKPIRAEVVKLK